VSLRGAKRRSNLIQNKEYANDKIANKGNIMRLRRSLRSLAMTGVNKEIDLIQNTVENRQATYTIIGQEQGKHATRLA